VASKKRVLNGLFARSGSGGLNLSKHHFSNLDDRVQPKE
jgi:hypothetical protein